MSIYTISERYPMIGWLPGCC